MEAKLTKRTLTGLIFIAGVIVLASFLVVTNPVTEWVDRTTRNVDVLDPISIDALPGLSSGTSWDSGFIALASPVFLAGRDGVIIRVDFSDGILRMVDSTTGISPERFTLELMGTVVMPEEGSSGHTDDIVGTGFKFDDLAAASGAAGGLVSISAPEGRGLLEQSVNLVNEESQFGGFTLEIYQNGAGELRITGVRVSLEADVITHTE